MIRAVLDTNVLVSAAIRPQGPPGQIVLAFLAHGAFEMILPPAIIDETEQVLRSRKIRKVLVEPDDAVLWLADLAALADLVPDTGNVVGICRDPADDVILSAALEGRADAIVTGDDDLLTLGEYESVEIVTPRTFLGWIAG